VALNLRGGSLKRKLILDNGIWINTKPLNINELLNKNELIIDPGAHPCISFLSKCFNIYIKTAEAPGSEINNGKISSISLFKLNTPLRKGPLPGADLVKDKNNTSLVLYKDII
jgi:hypothetical protein